MLTTNGTIKSFVLNQNTLGTRAITALAEMLKKNTSLRRLELANAGVTDEKAFLLAASLASNVALREIVLNGNDLSAEGSK